MNKRIAKKIVKASYYLSTLCHSKDQIRRAYVKLSL